MLSFPCRDNFDVDALRDAVAALLLCDRLDIAVQLVDARVTVSGPPVLAATDEQAADIAVLVRRHGGFE